MEFLAAFPDGREVILPPAMDWRHDRQDKVDLQKTAEDAVRQLDYRLPWARSVDMERVEVVLYPPHLKGGKVVRGQPSRRAAAPLYDEPSAEELRTTEAELLGRLPEEFRKVVAGVARNHCDPSESSYLNSLECLIAEFEGPCRALELRLKNTGR